MNRMKLTAMIAVFSLVPILAFAHSTGASWNVSSGPYTVDIGYDPASFAAGQYTRFDFRLWRGTDEEGTSVKFAQVWTRILRGDTTLLATGIWRQSVGPTTLLFNFTEPGSYVLDVSYRDDAGNDIATSSIPISVGGGSTGSTPFVGLWAFLAGAFLSGVTTFFFRRRA